ncbi:MAG: rhomboid family intramembrane serine protease [Candidatus Bathyarchaeia archaeon]
MPVTYWLIGVNVAVFAVLALGPGYLYRLVGQVSLLVLQYGFYWQPFTAIFVHFDILHLALNMFGLYYFGLMNEAIYGRKRFLAVYFGSGLVGNVASLFLLSPLTVSGGASGAVFGIIGSYAVYQRRGQQLAGALVYAGLIFVQSMGFGVNLFAHLFGLAAGILLGLILTPHPQR